MFKVFAIGNLFYFCDQNMQQSYPFADHFHAVVCCEKAALEFEVGETLARHTMWEA